MKIKEKLVITLCDFARLIDYPTFHSKKRQFIRDLNPQRCYYWTDKQKLLFEVIKTWMDIEEGVVPESEWTFSININEGGCGSEIVGFKDGENIQLNHAYDNDYLKLLKHVAKDNDCLYIGIIALNELIERQIGLSDVVSDLNAQIIRVSAGSPLFLNGLSSVNTNKTYSVRKVEAIGADDSPVEIYIDNTMQKSLEPGECVYIVCKGEEFVKILPNEIEKEGFRLTLSNEHGIYTSKLVVEDTTRGITDTYKNVTSFTLGRGGGFAYIENGKLKSRWINRDRDISFLLEPFDLPISVSSDDADHIFVLLENGIVRSTISNS